MKKLIFCAMASALLGAAVEDGHGGFFGFKSETEILTKTHLDSVYHNWTTYANTMIGKVNELIGEFKGQQKSLNKKTEKSAYDGLGKDIKKLEKIKSVFEVVYKGKAEKTILDKITQADLTLSGFDSIKQSNPGYVTRIAKILANLPRPEVKKRIETSRLAERYHGFLSKLLSIGGGEGLPALEPAAVN